METSIESHEDRYQIPALHMTIDPRNPVVALCAAGMGVEGDAERARELFGRAWEARRDDYEAAIAAHYVARHQPDDGMRLEWNARAVSHAEAAIAAGDVRVRELMASLYLNLGDALLTVGRRREAHDAAMRAQTALASLREDGYGRFIAGAVARLLDRSQPETTPA